MKNFSININGDEYWISRSIATAGFVFSKNENNEYVVLITKRGKGTPNYQGYWCAPCGYLDYDETIKECCIREIFEETGIKIDIESNLNKMYSYNDDPHELRQNVTFRWQFFSENYYFQPFDTSNSEPNEVEDVKWITKNEIKNYKFAFNHDQIIGNLFSQFEV